MRRDFLQKFFKRHSQQRVAERIDHALVWCDRYLAPHRRRAEIDRDI